MLSRKLEHSAEPLDPSGFLPVFILGLNRSGTTLLYHLLHATGLFNSVTAFHLVYKDRLAELNADRALFELERTRLKDWFGERNITDRTYDAIPVGPDFPEEYCSAIESNSIKPVITPANIHKLKDFFASVQRCEGPGRPLLLKNPFETGNFLIIRQLLPGSRFIFIHRNPLAVISSQIQMFGALFREPVEYDMRVDEKYRKYCESFLLRTVTRAICRDELPFLFWRIYRNLLKTCKYVVENEHQVSGVSFHLTYEQLCRKPDESVSSVLRFLEFNRWSVPDFSKSIRPRNQELHPWVNRFRARIEEKTAFYRERFQV